MIWAARHTVIRMRVRARILRLVGVVVILVGVFFASFFAALMLRQPVSSEALSQEVLAQGTLLSTTGDSNDADAAGSSSSVAPALSEPAITVATTDPVLAFVEGATEATSTTTSSSTTTTTIPEVVEPLDIDPVFAPVHDRLASEVEIPVRLPVTLGDAAANWVPTVGSITPTSYTIHLGDTDDCNGTSTCRVSTFTARQSTSAAPQLPAGTTVPLPNDMSGIFIDSTCGAGCNNGFIVWIEDGVRYSVGSRIGSGPDVLDLAWRTIDTALPTPTGPELCGPGAPKHDGAVARTITTTIDDERQMHWVAVCSALGLDLEIIESPGELSWADVDSDGTFNTVVRHDDGTSTIFAIANNRPLGVIDASAGGRLVVGDLACATQSNQRVAIDKSSNELLDFVNATTVRRIADPNLSGWTIGDC